MSDKKFPFTLGEISREVFSLIDEKTDKELYKQEEEAPELEKVLVESITLNKKTLLLKKGSTSTIGYTFTPTDATDSSVSWASSEQSKVSVTSAGVAKGLLVGQSTITATTNDGSEKSDTCEVTVYQPVTSCAWETTTSTLPIGSAVEYSVSVTPSDTTVKSISVVSGTPAKIRVNGNPTLVSAGSYKVSIEGLVDGESELTLTVTDSGDKSVTAAQTIRAYKAVESISFAESTYEIHIGDAATKFSPTITPADNTEVLVWESQYDDIATVDNSGNVTPVAEGSTLISVSTTIGATKVTGSYTLTVSPAVGS